MDLISIRQAASQGIERVRQPNWATAEDHIKIDIIDGRPGPWTHLFCPFNRHCNGRDPVDILFTGIVYDEQCFVPYTGPASGTDEYTAAVARYESAFAKVGR